MVIILASPVSTFTPRTGVEPWVILHGDDLSQYLVPDVVDGFESVRETQSIVHRVLGRPYPDVTLRPATARTGTLKLVFGNEAAAAHAEAVHAAPGILKLQAAFDYDANEVIRPTVEMLYVPAGRITRTLDPDTRDVWIVTVDFQEVEP